MKPLGGPRARLIGFPVGSQDVRPSQNDRGGADRRRHPPADAPAQARRRADGGTAAGVAQEQIEVFGIGVKK
jgi:hypothetical protein